MIRIKEDEAMKQSTLVEIGTNYGAVSKGLPSRLRAVMRENEPPKWITDQQRARITAHAAGRDVGRYRSVGKPEMANELVRIGRMQRAASRS